MYEFQINIEKLCRFFFVLAHFRHIVNSTCLTSFGTNDEPLLFGFAIDKAEAIAFRFSGDKHTKQTNKKCHPNN